MFKNIYTIIRALALVCAILSYLAILSGDKTMAPKSGTGIIIEGDNLNDVHYVIKNKKEEIYTLGYTCVQKFSETGQFMGGAYYEPNSVKQLANNEFLSLSNGNVVLLSCSQNTVYVFDDNFNVVEKIKVDDKYDELDFYIDYPNTDIADTEIRFALFSNKVISGEEKIQLDAPRNMLYSKNAGIIILFIAGLIILGPKLFLSREEW